jgi:tetratricopeptide (TPR) repeat protein
LLNSYESAEALLEFAYQLEYRGRYKVAARMYLLAARRGDSNGWLYLAENRKGRGDSPAAEAVLRIAADNGITDAKVDIAEILYGRGDAATAKAILKALLVDDSQDFENRPIAWDVLAQICDDTGDLMTARHWMRLAASAGDAYAGEKLAANGRGSEKSALRELRMAATRVRLVDRKLERARQRIVSLSARSQEAFEWAVEKYTADSGEEERIGDSADSLIMLGRIYCAGGEYGTARTIFLRAINVLDDPYEYGVIPALVELVKVMKKEGDWESAERFWKFGLELDGTVCDAWNAVDQLPLGERSSDGQPGSSGREGDSAVGGLPYVCTDLGRGRSSRRGVAPAVSLQWDNLDDDAFERVLYDLLRDIPGYENVQWLTQTRAPDRGRDLSLDRFLPDAAGALRCERVIVQAKHWLRRSVRPGDITDTLAAIKLWEPPVIRCLVIATSGRFSADAVAWIERQNDSGAVPLIEPWPTPKLEALIAERPELARAHGLCD